MKAFFRTVLLLSCAAALCLTAFGADGETLFEDEYCFSAEDFATGEVPDLNGIFVTAVPEDSVAAVRLGDRIIRPGDLLTVDVLDRLRLSPACQENCNAEFAYQPVFGGALGENTRLTIRIQSGKNETPKAIQQEFETYKNIANDGVLTGCDPENAQLTFQLVEKPKRGTVKLEADGTYVYTPDKNKVGEDSFTFTVTDEAGNVSSPAKVNIKILKPSEAMTFADMEGNPDAFEAMWLCERKLSSGRSIAGTPCFCPEDTVSRTEFLIMAMELMDVPVDSKLTISGFTDAKDAPAWVQPYLASAMQRGLVNGEVRETGLLFRPNDPVTGREAAVMLQNILKLPVSASAIREEDWGAEAVQTLGEAGITFSHLEENLTRREAAKLLWQAAQV